jgi:hypothetical protein
VHGSLLLLAVALGACRSGSPARSATTTAAAPVHPKRGEGAMRDVRPTAMGERLKAAGLDPKDLPPIESLDRKTKLKVMKTFTESLGVACVDCHAGLDFAADTRRKRVAKRMWNEITRVVALDADAAGSAGDAMYCDSCHQGDLFILDRRDKAKVTTFMTDVYDQKLKRTDGRDHDCATCHGDPPDLQFLTKWREHPAPDIAK